MDNLRDIETTKYSNKVKTKGRAIASGVKFNVIISLWFTAFILSNKKLRLHQRLADLPRGIGARNQSHTSN